MRLLKANTASAKAAGCMQREGDANADRMRREPELGINPCTNLNHDSQAPLIAVLLFGIYSVGALAHGVLTFRDCPDEAASLQQVYH